MFHSFAAIPRQIWPSYQYFVNRYKINQATNWKKATYDCSALLSVSPYKILAQFIQPNSHMKSKFFFDNSTDNRSEMGRSRDFVMQKAKPKARSGENVLPKAQKFQENKWKYFWKGYSRLRMVNLPRKRISTAPVPKDQPWWENLGQQFYTPSASIFGGGAKMCSFFVIYSSFAKCRLKFRVSYINFSGSVKRNPEKFFEQFFEQFFAELWWFKNFDRPFCYEISKMQWNFFFQKKV